jgi:hypothetical protein
MQIKKSKNLRGSSNNLLNVLLQSNGDNDGNFNVTLELDNAKIGSFLKSMRLIKLMTLMDIQNATKISYQQIKKYEENKSRISINNLASILEALGLYSSLQITTETFKENTKNDKK